MSEMMQLQDTGLSEAFRFRTALEGIHVMFNYLRMDFPNAPPKSVLDALEDIYPELDTEHGVDIILSKLSGADLATQKTVSLYHADYDILMNILLSLDIDFYDLEVALTKKYPKFVIQAVFEDSSDVGFYVIFKADEEVLKQYLLSKFPQLLDQKIKEELIARKI